MSLLAKFRLGAELGLMAALLIGGWQYLQDREEFARQEALAEQRAERIVELAARGDSLAEAKAAADSAAREDSLQLAETRDSLQAERRRAQAAQREAQAEADSAADALEATLARLRAKALEVAPSLVPAVDTAQAQFQAHQRADQRVQRGWQDQMAAQVELTEGWRETAGINFDRWQRAELQLGTVTEERDELRLQVEFWKDAAEPDFFSTLGSEVPKLLAAFGAGAGACAAFC